MTHTRHIIPVSGKDSLATALVQTTRQPDLPYEFLFNDVRAELPETYQWLDMVEARTGWSIVRTGVSLPDLIDRRGGFLPSVRARYCTRECKIKPMEAMLGRDPCVVYYGLRADETRTGYVPLGKPNITPQYPLQELGIDLRGVYAILDAQDLTPPTFHWERVYLAVHAVLGGWNDWDTRLTRAERGSLFAWRTRANCFFCFFQRQYEFLGLREHHPDLFARALSMEARGYTFQPGWGLANLDNESARVKIFDRRVNDVVKMIRRRFDENTATWEDTEISRTSCGLLCGK